MFAVIKNMITFAIPKQGNLIESTYRYETDYYKQH